MPRVKSLAIRPSPLLGGVPRCASRIQAPRSPPAWPLLRPRVRLLRHREELIELRHRPRVATGFDGIAPERRVLEQRTAHLRRTQFTPAHHRKRPEPGELVSVVRSEYLVPCVVGEHRTALTHGLGQQAFGLLRIRELLGDFPLWIL